MCNLNSLEGGDQLVSPMCQSYDGLNGFCTASCPAGKNFDSAPEYGLRNMWWCVNGQITGITRVPDCAGTKHAQKLTN